MTNTPSDCDACIQSHESHVRTEEALAQPISAIVDGWILSSGDLHVGVRMPNGDRRYITLPRYANVSIRKRSAL